MELKLNFGHSVDAAQSLQMVEFLIPAPPQTLCYLIEESTQYFTPNHSIKRSIEFLTTDGSRNFKCSYSTRARKAVVALAQMRLR